MKQLAIAIILTLSYSIKAFSCECSGPYEFKTKEDLKEYVFIAFASIDSVYISDISKAYEHDIFYQADLEILELFKGDTISSILVYGGNSSLGGTITSCDIGIDQHEKWVVFAYRDKNNNFRTGYCTFSKMYSSATGEKDWQYERGIKELILLREIFDHDVPAEKIPNGIKKSYYPNGTIEIEQSFENDLPNGQKTVYYPNGHMMIDENYENGRREGKSIWYDRNGRIERDFQFSNGHPVDTCYYYWFFNGQVQHERIFDKQGDMIKNSSYTHEGVLKEVSMANSETNQYIKTSYYESGAIRYVAISKLESYQSIRTTEFYESGAKEKEWEYYPNDSTRVFKFWEWSADGELSSNYILLKDGTKIDLINEADNKH